MKRHHLLLFSALILFTGCSAPSPVSETPERITQTAIGEPFDINLQSEQGMRFLEEKKYTAAIDIFTEIIENDENNAEAYIRRASAYVSENESTDNFTLALADYENARLLNQELAEVWLGIVDVYIRMDDYQTALEFAEMGYEITGDSSVGDKAEQLRSGNITDSDNKTRRRTKYDTDGIPVYYWDYRYSSDQRPEAITSYHPDGEQIDHLELEYDDEGRATKKVVFLSSGGLDPVYLTYDARGNISERTTYHNSDGSMYLHEFCEYDEQGNMVKLIRRNGDDTLLGYDICTYNEHNQMILQKEYDDTDQLIRYRCVEYNFSGKRIKESFYKPDDTLYRYLVFLYDDTGLFLGSEKYNGDHKLVESLTYE